MFQADYDPALRAAMPGGGRRGAARRRRAARPADPRGRPLRRPRLAARLLHRPLRDDLRGDAAALGPGHADRPAPGRRRAAARRAGAGRVQPVRPGRRGRGRDRPLPALAGRPARRRRPSPAAPYPARPDADPPGRRGPAHAAGGLRADRGPDPGLARLVVPGVGHAIIGDDPSGCGVRGARCASWRTAACPRPARACPPACPASHAPPASFASLARRQRAAGEGRAHRCARSRRRSTTSLIVVLRRRSSPRPAAACAAARWSLRGAPAAARPLPGRARASRSAASWSDTDAGLRRGWQLPGRGHERRARHAHAALGAAA